ncbi:MAG: RdgB/HAM1 family non-canonical purine NTP pyrophosphatase [Ruminococcus sp.]|uniref:RdgB/HAM1 family non-canonical purine NTP pyrophosphatase n=1 Tax=Ruminococcus sp. TaxID=41978 RepID=UPI002873B266|nr:RdgB/HAM1 family non-canonical purine NTP pyrophosphatase [Ruminococcus sp.]MBQ3284958.1 RdgB/HAM1 family non-canonical purine NTP pyrophosphatase [Ruminococcus sp.]
MKEFIIATNNSHKVVEIERILSPLGVTAVTAKERGVDLGDVAEDGDTFAANAYIKAKHAFDLCHKPVIADDSGLCVDALGGRPGVYSARYAGADASPLVKISKLLDEMKDVPDAERSAHFTCAVCCILDEDTVIEVEGRCDGMIARELSGDGGFGYDPVFVVDGRSFADLTAEEKDRYSHRGSALRKLRDALQAYSFD